MKTMRTLLATFAIALSAMTMNAQPMSYAAMCNNARFLTDRMAHTLGIAAHLIDDLYMINFDYIYGVNDYLDDVAYGYHADDYAIVLAARDAALRRLLTPYQWQRYITYDYFYRPIVFNNYRWRFGIYAFDSHLNHFYFHAPRPLHTYHGGHYFGGMRPAGGRVGPGRVGGPAPGGHPNNPGHPGGNYNGTNRGGNPYGNGNAGHGGNQGGGNGNAGGNHNGGYQGGGNHGGSNQGGGNPNGGRDNNRGGNVTPTQPGGSNNGNHGGSYNGSGNNRGNGGGNNRGGGSNNRPSSTRATIHNAAPANHAISNTRPATMNNNSRPAGGTRNGSNGGGTRGGRR